MPSSPNPSAADARVLTAMAHPLRRRLLDILRVDRAATASGLSRKTEQAVGNISHHLHVLARAGLIEEAPELARDQRERWWRRSSESIRWSALDADADPADVAVGTAAEAINLEHQLALTRSWLQKRERFAEPWQRAAFSSDGWLHLTVDELQRFDTELNELLLRWSSGGAFDEDPDRESVFVFARGFPAAP